MGATPALHPGNSHRTARVWSWSRSLRHALTQLGERCLAPNSTARRQMHRPASRGARRIWIAVATKAQTARSTPHHAVFRCVIARRSDEPASQLVQVKPTSRATRSVRPNVSGLGRAVHAGMAPAFQSSDQSAAGAGADASSAASAGAWSAGAGASSPSSAGAGAGSSLMTPPFPQRSMGPPLLLGYRGCALHPRHDREFCPASSPVTVAGADAIRVIRDQRPARHPRRHMCG
jgi:hypothetical protein